MRITPLTTVDVYTPFFLLKIKIVFYFNKVITHWRIVMKYIVLEKPTKNESYIKLKNKVNIIFIRSINRNNIFMFTYILFSIFFNIL